jgi:hypothetical protein
LSSGTAASRHAEILIAVSAQEQGLALATGNTPHFRP